MCGIAGVWAYHYAANGVEQPELLAMHDYMARRGPDGSGIWFADDRRIGFAHRRLAIIDLSDNGLQPMHSADGRFVITFNGEIYNYKELRRALRTKGYRFRTESDTEVLLHLYAERGIEMVRDLRGMFAFALWDARERIVVLARDPYGIKPLYYSDDGWTCRFASQVKALLAGGAISSDPDPAGEVGFYLFGSVPEPYTTWRAIRSVPSGATIVIDRKGPRFAVALSLHRRGLSGRRAARACGAGSAGCRARCAARFGAQPSGGRCSGRRVLVFRHRFGSARRTDARCRRR